MEAEDEQLPGSANELREALHKTINYFRKEHLVSYAEMLGVLEFVKLDIQQEIIAEEEL